jgi:hypothetical protein
LIFTITTIAAVITNAALVVFTMNYLDGHSSSFRFWFFCIFQWIMFGLLAGLMEAIPDIPIAIAIQLQRQQILVERVIFRVKDALGNDQADETLTPPTPSGNHHYQIYDYFSFLQHQKQSPFSPKMPLRNVSQKLLSLISDDNDEGTTGGGRSPNLSTMPTIYALPPPKRGKYSYSRASSSANNGSSRILDDSQVSEEEM